jgi:hypothetical protein
MKVHGEAWYLSFDSDGIYLHLEKGKCKLAVSLGHKSDTVDDVFNAIMRFNEFCEQEENSLKEP